MKVIDLLNKIANDEEVPKEVEVGLKHYIYENNGEYYDSSDPCNLLFDFNDDYQLRTCLNQIVYPITYEEKKIPEKMDRELNCDDDTLRGLVASVNEIYKEIADKYNEIIDYLKNKGE